MIHKTITYLLMMLTMLGSNFTSEIKANGEESMTNWSLGRIDFTIPEQFKLIGSSQSIYHVEVSTSMLNGKTANEIWDEKLKIIKATHLAAAKDNEQIKVEEIEPGFPVVAYRENKSSQLFMTVEGQKDLGNSILALKYQGRAGKENDMKRLLSITAEGYKVNSPNGFSVGAGSLTSKPSVNEYAGALFRNNDIEVNITVETAGTYLTKHPLDDIDHEIKGLAQDGMTLKVLKNEQREVAGFAGYEGLITFEGKDDPAQFRYTWFTPGVTADSFKPEILIKVHGPLDKIEEFRPIWESLLKSLRMRPATK